MPFPGYPLPTNKTNVSAQQDDHPAHHNDLGVAVNDLQDQIDALSASVSQRPIGVLSIGTDSSNSVIGDSYVDVITLDPVNVEADRVLRFGFRANISQGSAVDCGFVASVREGGVEICRVWQDNNWPVDIGNEAFNVSGSGLLIAPANGVHTYSLGFIAATAGQTITIQGLPVTQFWVEDIGAEPS